MVPARSGENLLAALQQKYKFEANRWQQLALVYAVLAVYVAVTHAFVLVLYGI
jgi:hypothetical protein